MGILVKSTSVRTAAKPRLRAALDKNPAEISNADDEASGQAADVEEESRKTTINLGILVLIVVFLGFIVVAGIYTESQGIPEWGERLTTVFNVLWPLLLGYFGGEFVAEKTK